MVEKSIITPEETASSQYIIGIGASAGGMEAIHDLFENMPANTGFSFVVVQHLSPDHKSLMPDLLSRHTPMQVFEAEDGMLPRPDCVYVLPSKKIMTIQYGRLKLDDKVKDRLPNTAVDIFFESLAQDQSSKAVGIILSGSGTDGTRGIEAIKSENGLVIVQDPLSAAFDGMPGSAVASGLADIILPPDMIGEELVASLRDEVPDKPLLALQPTEEAVLQEILAMIQHTTRHDFSHYKRPTLYRRMAKRMLEMGISTIEAYYEHLQNNPQEVTALSKEFLINVTKFFRDAEAFELLQKQVIPGILTNKTESDTVKIWVAACSSGEEAYSIAMLVQEHLEQNSLTNLTVKVFASDIDSDALETASRGVYPASIEKDLLPARLLKFFNREKQNYQVAPFLRKMVVFAQHDVLKDPPFSRVDLVSCRNMLIYIDPMLQKTVLKKFHFALNPQGYLLLGPSENIGLLKENMQEIERKWKLYQCISKSRDYEQDSFFVPFEPKAISRVSPPTTTASKNALNNIGEIFKETMLEMHRFAGIFLDKEFNVKHAIGEFKQYLRFPDGNFNLNVLKLVSSELAIPLGICLRKALNDNEKVTMPNVKLYEGTEAYYVNIVVKPWLQSKDYLQPFLFVVLEEGKIEKKASEVVVSTTVGSVTRIEELEAELRETRQGLQAVIEEMESTNEELQSQGEEMVSTNEELQSTNEELQSLNEELYTVSAEHQLKIKELIELNDDLNNYFKNSDIGQILVDRKLTVRRFSPAATRMVNLIDGDIGRSILDITTNIKQIDLANNIKAVLKSAQPMEKEIALEDGRFYSLRITPYLRRDKTVNGAVINFIDVTQTRRLTSVLESVLNSSISGITAKKAVYDEQGEIIDFEFISVNSAAEKTFGLPTAELIGKRLLQVFPRMNPQHIEQFKEVVRTGEPRSFDSYDERLDRWYNVTNVKMLDGLVTTFTDITEDKKMATLLAQNYTALKTASDSLAETNIQLERSNLDLMQFASVASHDLKEPLRKIQVFGSMLHDRVKEKVSEEDLEFLAKIITASQRMQTLIEDVLTYSKLSNGELPRKPVDLRQIVRQIIEDLEITIRDKNAVLEIGELPTVLAVGGQMRQLFQNLIANALKFSDKPQTTVHIKEQPITAAQAQELHIQPADYVCIMVEDNGIGFEEKYRERIFGLFQRLGGRNYEGTGIGLSIAKKIVENHGGYLTAQGELGQGAAFFIFLPK